MQVIRIFHRSADADIAAVVRQRMESDDVATALKAIDSAATDDSAATIQSALQADDDDRVLVIGSELAEALQTALPDVTFDASEMASMPVDCYVLHPAASPTPADTSGGIASTPDADALTPEVAAASDETATTTDADDINDEGESSVLVEGCLIFIVIIVLGFVLRPDVFSPDALRAAIASFGDDAPLTDIDVVSQPQSTSVPDDVAETLPEAEQVALNGVDSNADWETFAPYARDFDEVAMVLVPTGCFMMGDDTSGTPEDETPVHEQCVDAPFWIDRYIVSQAQFRRLEGEAAQASARSGNNLPRENLTWEEAAAFCVLRGGRLPTEKEWEYAARGVDGLTYPWGDAWDATLLNSGANAGADDYTNTSPVDLFEGSRSWVGAQQLSGNVWEWTASLFRPYPYDASDGRENTANTVSNRVMRGGSWFFEESVHFRGAERGSFPAAEPSGGRGFRCARDYVAGDTEAE